MITGIAFAPDTHHLASCDVNHAVILWNLSEGTPDLTIPGTAPLYALAFAEGGRRLVTAGKDALIRLEPLTIEELIQLADERVGGEPSAKEGVIAVSDGILR